MSETNGTRSVSWRWTAVTAISLLVAGMMGWMTFMANAVASIDESSRSNVKDIAANRERVSVLESQYSIILKSLDEIKESIK